MRNDTSQFLSCHLTQSGTSLSAFDFEVFSFRHISRFETIGRNDIHRFVQELFTLAGCDVTYGSEAVCPMGCLFLHRVLRHHIQFLRHLVSIVVLEIVIQRFAVSCDRTTDTRGMRSEQRRYLRTAVTQIEDRESRLPFVGMHAEIGFLALLCFRRQPLIETLHDHTGSITEQARLIIIAVSSMALDLERIPCPPVYRIFLRPKGIEFQQYCNRFSGHMPTTDPNRNVCAFPSFGPIA